MARGRRADTIRWSVRQSGVVGCQERAVCQSMRCWNGSRRNSGASHPTRASVSSSTGGPAWTQRCPTRSDRRHRLTLAFRNVTFAPDFAQGRARALALLKSASSLATASPESKGVPSRSATAAAPHWSDAGAVPSEADATAAATGTMNEDTTARLMTDAVAVPTPDAAITPSLTSEPDSSVEPAVPEWPDWTDLPDATAAPEWPRRCRAVRDRRHCWRPSASTGAVHDAASAAPGGAMWSPELPSLPRPTGPPGPTGPPRSTCPRRLAELTAMDTHAQPRLRRSQGQRPMPSSPSVKRSSAESRGSVTPPGRIQPSPTKPIDTEDGEVLESAAMPNRLTGSRRRRLPAAQPRGSSEPAAVAVLDVPELASTGSTCRDRRDWPDATTAARPTRLRDRRPRT